MEKAAKVWTKEEIRAKLETDNQWLFRAVRAIFDRQTAAEQVSETTSEDNGIGFNGADAEILSSYAKFLTKAGFLTPKQLPIARRKMLKYSGQLAKIANGKI